MDSSEVRHVVGGANEITGAARAAPSLRDLTGALTYVGPRTQTEPRRKQRGVLIMETAA